MKFFFFFLKDVEKKFVQLRKLNRVLYIDVSTIELRVEIMTRTTNLKRCLFM